MSLLGTKTETVLLTDNRVTLNRCDYLTVLGPFIVVLTNHMQLSAGIWRVGKVHNHLVPSSLRESNGNIILNSTASMYTDSNISWT